MHLIASNNNFKQEIDEKKKIEETKNSEISRLKGDYDSVYRDRDTIIDAIKSGDQNYLHNRFINPSCCIQ